jgi:hypothetical protein
MQAIDIMGFSSTFTLTKRTLLALLALTAVVYATTLASILIQSTFSWARSPNLSVLLVDTLLVPKP